MKKWIAFMLVFVLAFVFIGCGGGGPDENHDDEKAKVTKVVINGLPTGTIQKDEEAQLTADVQLSAGDQTGVDKGVVWSVRPAGFVSIDQTGKIKGEAAGVATVVATSKENPKYSGQLQVTVTVPVVYDPAESIEIDEPKLPQVTVGSYLQMKAAVLPSTAKQDITWSSSDTAIATVDKGKVYGVAEGEVTITATVTENNELFDTYVLTIVPDQGGPETVPPTSVSIKGETIVYEGRWIYLSSVVLPSGASQNVTWKSSDETIATVTQEGGVFGLKQGKTTITATTYKADNTPIESNKLLVNVKAIPVFPIPDLGGYTIQILTDSVSLVEHDPTNPDYTPSDQAAKLEAWNYVKSAYNCNLQVIAYPTEAPWGPSRTKWLIDNATANTVQADFAVVTSDWVKTLADGGAVLETKSFYEKYGQNVLGPAFKQATTYKSGLYGVPSGGSGGIQVDKGLFYNYGLLKNLGLESPAKLFNEGKWTYTDFKNYVATADAALKSEDQTVLSGMPAMYWFGMVNAAGIRLADPDYLTMNFDDAYAREAAKVLRDIYVAYGWGTMDWDEKVTSFNDGKSIFQSGEYWFVDSSLRWKPDLWGEGTQYGFVPYPYPDKMSKNDTRTIFAGATCYMQLKGKTHPAGVTDEFIYQAFVNMIIRTVDNALADEEVDEETLMRRSANARLDDPESVNAILFFKRDKVIYDPAYGMLPVYSTGNIGPSISFRVVQGGEDYTQVMAEITDVYQSRLNELFG